MFWVAPILGAIVGGLIYKNLLQKAENKEILHTFFYIERAKTFLQIFLYF